MSKRGSRVPRPPVPPEWGLRFADKTAAGNWEKLCNIAVGNCAEGELSSGRHDGKELEQWQYEVTGAGRAWFLIDDAKRRVLLTAVTLGHPSKTDR